MKKLLLILLTLFMFTACSSKQEEVTTSKDSSSACGIETCEEEEKASYKIAENQITIADVVNKLENKESFVLYMYFDACPWCKELGPIVSDYLSDKDDLFNITYALNVRADGTKENDLRYKDDDGNYNEPLFETIYNFIRDQLDEDGVVYVPALLFIKNGELVYFHTGTVEGHDATERTLTDEEKQTIVEELKEYYSIYND